MKVSPYIDYSSIGFKKEEIERSISKRFEDQVEKFPQRLAIKLKSQEVTYVDLNRTANRIAREICAIVPKGAEPVALFFEPGIGLIAAILGVLKTGRVWVLLDPSYPVDRLSYLLQDSEAGLILSNDKNVSTASDLPRQGRCLINVDEIDPDVSDANLDQVVPPEAFAHIIYTSGSTGKPKGVVHNHRLVLHNIWLHTNSLDLCPDDRISLFSSLSHQAGIADLYRALLNGATLLPFNLRKNGFVDLPAWLKEEGITIYHSVPTVFRQLIDNLPEGCEFPDLRVIHLGGEPVLKLDVDLYRKHFSSNCILTVILGASEAPTFRHNYIDRSSQLDNDIVSVGYPVEDKEVLLLDDQGQAVGFNQIGEIAVRSSFLASEYWKKPELTRKAFWDDPDGGDRRTYLTGDLGLMLPDGNLTYLGRKDKQVKIGGQRIEIGEVEAVLFDHSGIKSCAVVAKENNHGDKYLAAYIVPEKIPGLTVSELQNHLKQKLPVFMVPSKFVFLEKIPLLPNGKVDRHALQDYDDTSRSNFETEFVSPRDDIELQLKAIWEDVLGVHPVGIKDNFFELGGTSLIAAHLLTVIGTVFSRKLALASLFQAPTIEQLARLLRPQEWSPHVSSLVAMRSGGSKPPFFCVPGNMSIPFINLRHLASSLGPEQPFYGFQDGVQNPSRIEALAAAYLAEMVAVQSEGPYFLGGLCMGGLVAFEMAQQLLSQGHQVALLALMETVPPRGPGIGMFFNAMALYWHRVTRRLAHHSQATLQLSREEQKLYIRQKMKLNANSWALRRYAPRPYPGRIDLFLTPETLGSPDHPRLGWRNLATGGAEIHPIPGTNGTITGHDGVEVEEAHIGVLAQKLGACIDRAL